jgi:Animal haem peroxidase
MDRHADSRAESFRFSQMLPAHDGSQLDEVTLGRLARRLTRKGEDSSFSSIPAGYTYFGQFVAHDLSFDKSAHELERTLAVAELRQARSPALDLDSLYLDGPQPGRPGRFYADGDPTLKTGTTVPVETVPELRGHDLPRRATGTDAEHRTAVIPDVRNDDNVAVAQIHAAFIRLHNRVVATRTDADAPVAERYARARRIVTRHFQWIVWFDYLRRICDPGVLDDVWANGRKIFEPDADRHDAPTMPVEFSVAAFRLGHSMVRSTYTWNLYVDLDLPDLFANAGRGGDLGGFPRLRSTRVADLRRLFVFPGGDGGLAPVQHNAARRIDTRLTTGLRNLPTGTFDGTGEVDEDAHNLAFRNLMKARGIGLATGQAMAQHLAPHGVTALSAEELAGSATELDPLGPALGETGVQHTPLWVYVLREAELNGGVLKNVGARIVAETFHRAIQGSQTSILDDPDWQPTLGAGAHPYTLADLLLWAFEGDVTALAPLEAQAAGLR